MPWQEENWSDEFVAICQNEQIELTDDVLHVKIGEQKLSHWRAGQCLKSYPCSTSIRPPSNVENSLGTPCGLHRIEQRIGEGEAAGMVFVSRQPTGQCYWQREDAGPSQKALVTTRILWLRGLQPGINADGEVDTYNRYVYIHGSNLQDRIPAPLSAGCVLLKDPHLLELFDNVQEGTLVWIEL
jgi:hypothetical protein